MFKNAALKLSNAKKTLLIVLGIILGITSLAFFLVRLAFGPLHEYASIDLGSEGTLNCNVTYHGDFAQVFYDTKISLKTSNGKTFDVGSFSFLNQHWSKNISTARIGRWLVIALEPNNVVHIKILNTLTGQSNDTTLQAGNLKKDPLYRKIFRDGADGHYPGNSRIKNISGTLIEVCYEYAVKAAYPSVLFVSQTVVHQVDSLHGTLVTKYIYNRLAE